MDKIKQILKFAMRMEKDAEDFYEFYMDKAVSKETRELFAELAGIERQHFDILKKKFEQLEYSEPPITISWVVDDSFKARDPHILADNSDILPELDANAGDISVIRMAYLIETDFAYFYSKAAEAMEDAGVKKFLTELSGWEKQHSELFYKKYLSLLDENWKNIKKIFE